MQEVAALEREIVVDEFRNAARELVWPEVAERTLDQAIRKLTSGRSGYTSRTRGKDKPERRASGPPVGSLHTLTGNTEADLVRAYQFLNWLEDGFSLQAIGARAKLDRRTIKKWIRKAAVHKSQRLKLRSDSCTAGAARGRYGEGIQQVEETP